MGTAHPQAPDETQNRKAQACPAFGASAETPLTPWPARGLFAVMDIANIVLERLQQLPNMLIEWAPGVALAIGIFFAGRFVVRRLSRATVRASTRVPNIDETLARFFGTVVLIAGMTAVIVSALSAMHVNLAFLATFAASLLIALGFALQNSLGDVASGLMIMILRPYRVDDEVELSGQTGVVREIGLFATQLVTRDNIEVVISNSDALGNTIKNFYAFGDRRLELDCRIAYDDSIAEGIAAVLKAAEGDDRILAHPAPWAKVTGLGDSAVYIQLRVWCHADEYRKLAMDLPLRVKKSLDAAGLEIPFDYVVTHLRKEKD